MPLILLPKSISPEHLIQKERESSLKQLIDRVADTITRHGVQEGYFEAEAEAENFREELKYICATQRAAFNSPVWFNIGWFDRAQQASACFILGVEDTMESILNWYTEEGMIFKGGSGAGTNLSRLRSSLKLLVQVEVSLLVQLALCVAPILLLER